MKKNKRTRKFGLSLFFSLSVFINFFLTALLVGFSAFFLNKLGVLQTIKEMRPAIPFIITLVVCVLAGTAISQIIGTAVLGPIRSVIRATNKLAAGDFSARLSLQKPPEMAMLAKSFNRMAEELGNTEMLRSDFVNNFSHEFKTPIVSIKGFAEVLKYGTLTEQERNEYLDVVISESDRLSSLATNVLNLTKVENQTILSDAELFNVSEQIRYSIVLLQKKWETKCIDMTVEGADVSIVGNEELLSQVWLNLLDNAIKFAPENSKIAIKTAKSSGKMTFTIHNSGEAISEQALAHIFDKFNQGDRSHTTIGNGLGLTLADRIIALHGGTIGCESSEQNGTTFTVTLPLKQLLPPTTPREARQQNRQAD